MILDCTKKYLADGYPELVKEWSDKNGDLKPDMVTYGSNKIVWWKGNCGHEWKMSVKSRTMGQGCPYCAGVRVLIGDNDLATICPHLADEWSDKNEDYKPTDFTAGSSKKVWWKCKEGHEWEAVIKNRVNGSTCPYCSHRKVLAGVNDLVTVRPELALDWSPRNGKLKADMVSEFSNRKVWWKCHVCGYEWQSLISARSGGVKCLCCSGYVTVSGKNDLSITHPVLAGEWSDSNERGVNEYQSNNREYVWWQCSTCGYEWKAMIYNRVQGRCECPACKRAKQIERAVIKEKYLIDMREFEKHLREVCLLYYFDKAGYEVMEQDDSIIGVGLEFFCKELNVAVILSRPFHETIHGHRIENAKNDLCRKNNIRLIRILEAGCRTYDNCMCLQCDDESLESYDWALISMFNALGIAMNVDCERDMREMFLWYQKYQMSGKRLICKKMFGIIMPNG